MKLIEAKLQQYFQNGKELTTKSQLFFFVVLDGRTIQQMNCPNTSFNLQILQAA